MSPPPAPPGRAARFPRRHERERRRRRLAVLIVVLIVAVASLLVTAFGAGDHPAAPVSAPASASRLLPAGPPAPEVIARYGSLHLQLPVSQSRVTAIGYHGGTEGALALEPVGTQANQGLLRRVLHKVIGGGTGSPRWFQLAGGSGPSTSALAVGTAPGTDAYSPVDGTVVGLGDVVLNGRGYGNRIDIQPTGAPSIVVSVSHLRADPSLVVGAPVTSSGSKLGQVLDFSHAERQALARYTNDAGNHVLIEIHPAATFAVS
ncbi:MAG TPA: hypothetical protein VGJ70_05715 [Solirubrobacteraceae bacterium]